MTNSIEPVRRTALPPLLPSPSRPLDALRRGLTAVAGWARLTSGTLRLGGVDADARLDPQNRALLWHALTEMISTIGFLAASDLPPSAALAALADLASLMRERVAASVPRAGLIRDGTEPMQIFLLEILIHDLQPCLGRWQSRLEAWRQSGRAVNDWPLIGLCRRDVAGTRERLIERSWQLAITLGLLGLARLLPERPAILPELITADELDGAEKAATDAPDAASLDAGWRIYIEAASRFGSLDPLCGPSALGEAIGSLEKLAGALRAGLKSMPRPRSNGGETIQALALRSLTEELQPFLTEWRPRYRKFLASERAEAKWRRAEECRAALLAVRERCLPVIEAIGRRIAAPPLAQSATGTAAAADGSPLQLPPPG